MAQIQLMHLLNYTFIRALQAFPITQRMIRKQVWALQHELRLSIIQHVGSTYICNHIYILAFFPQDN